MGKNIYYVAKEGKHHDDFFVRVQFKLWLKFDVNIINIDLKYDVRSCFPGEQKILFNEDDNLYEKIDDSFRMAHPKALKSGTNDIFVSRVFRGEPDRGEKDDLKAVTLNIEVSSDHWKGIKHLIIEGKLGGAGRWNLSKIVFDSRSQKIEHRVVVSPT